MIDKRILELLNKISSLWHSFSDDQLKTIAPVWHNKLFKYSYEILDLAFEDLAERFHRRPSLAEFIEVCEVYKKKMRPFLSKPIEKEISPATFKAAIVSAYGDTAGQIVDKAYQEFERAKKNGTVDKYAQSVLDRMKGICKRKFKFYSTNNLENDIPNEENIVWG